MVGTHFHSLDEKGRIIVPAKLRLALTDQFWMMLDDNDNVALYNSSTGYSILRHCEEMMAQNPEDEEIAAAVERIASRAELVTAESGWRVSIPEVLRFWAKLEKEVVSVGVVNHVVLWSRDKWEVAQTKSLQDTEARKMQAGMMRAAASTIKKADDANGQGQAGEIAAAQAEPRIAGIESLGRSNAGAGSTGGDPSAASAGDGSRVPRVLALSKVGR
jgi:MraZ protein